MANDITTEKIWAEYGAGISYNDGLELTDKVKQNENMFIGRQWVGLEVETLRPVVLNFIKPTVLNKCAHLMSEDIQITVRPEGVEGQLEAEQEADVNILNATLARIWENQALTSLTRETLRDAAVTGDGCWHVAYDMEGNQAPGVVSGDIAVERIDNLNVMFGNPADARIQEQPFVLLISREYADKVRRRAPEGVEIEPSTDGYFNEETQETKLVTVITCYWRDWDTGRIWGCEAVEKGFLRKPYDTGLTRYPVVFMNWEKVRGSYHGEAVVSGMVLNQIAVNTLATMRKVSLSRTAFPTVIYQDDVLPNGWDNSVGAAIGVPRETPVRDVMMAGAAPPAPPMPQ